MTIIEMIFLGTLSGAVFFLLLFFLFFLLFQRSRSGLKKLPDKKKIRNPKKRKRLVKKKRQLEGTKKRQFRNMLIFLILGVLLGGASAFISYYQSMNLTENDANSIIQGYYLLDDFEAQIVKAGNESDSQQKLDANIRYLASSISSYGTKRGDAVNTEEGQLLLNQYYKAMQDLGINAVKVSGSFYKNNELVKEYQADIEKVKKYQEKVMVFYKVDQSKLKQEPAD